MTDSAGRPGSKPAPTAGGARVVADPFRAAAPVPESLPTGGSVPTVATAASRTTNAVITWATDEDRSRWPLLPAYSVREQGRHIRPYSITANYNGRSTGVDPHAPIEWFVSVHVVGRLVGRSNRVTAEYRSWFLDSRTPADEWPQWIRTPVDLYHPARGGPDLDPTGSYL